jgi:competence protein ComEA
MKKGMKKRIGAFVLCLLLSGCGSSGLTIRTMTDGTEEPGTVETVRVTSEERKQEIVVYVCGAVASEGVYTLPADSRAEDALQAAGGYAENAARGAVNLAKHISDGEKLYFPAEGETEELSGNSDGRVNINTADKNRLMTLPGIGERKAEDILAYREEHGDFRKTEDLMQVPGIKDAAFQKLKERITVD